MPKRLLLWITLAITWFAFCTPASAAEETAQAAAIRSSGLTVLDWVVLGVYALGMVLIGVGYSQRNRSSDDYLLGGRTMRPWMVGLSMFATFSSVLTYLAMPGEMIRHGPMMLAQLLPLPVVAVIVCFLIIPFIMKFPVTSGYEILELRFGESVRLLGATMFLFLRLLWMGVMIYATVDKAFVPVVGLDPTWAPYLCVALGLITVVYSSLGGLRAVVLSDSIQAFILFFGALLAMLMITFDLGGVSAWFPTRWEPHWDPFKLGFSTEARVTVAAATTAALLWWIATAGSDQMAIQRYLATRDIKSARRMFNISLGASAFMLLMLGLLGFALLGYFQHHPEMLATGESITESADQLLPRYIVVGLPSGLSGLLVAALLAATMSSLSAGVNSASLVITVDLLGRLRKTAPDETDRFRAAKRASWMVGLVAIVLSLMAGNVAGNLVEVCFKLANLLVVPLFLLFFMAMFVPWATTPGTWAAAIASATAAVGIAFFKWFGLEFLWISIGSLIVGVIVGPLVSLLPIRRRSGPRREDHSVDRQPPLENTD